MWQDLEAVRFEPAVGEPAPRPEHFDERYKLPEHRIKLCQTRNPHPLDERIVFYEEEHIYTVDGAPVEVSVSGVLPEAPFDADGAIKSMKFSRREAWPRRSCVKNPVKVASRAELRPDLGCLLFCPEAEVTVASFRPGAGGEGGEALGRRLDEAALARGHGGPADAYTFERELTADEIKQQWADHAEDARNRGTEAHLQMELFFNSEPCRLDDPEVVVGLEFVRKFLLPLRVKPYRTEWEIFAVDEDVAGSIDLAVILPDGRLVLIDWKRSEKLPKKMRGYGKLEAPFRHLPECAGVRYAMQLSLYQYVIEKYYGYRVAGRALASLHPNAPFCTATPYLEDEVEYLMARRRDRAAARKAVAAERPDLACARSGALLTDAVRGAEDGALYSRKAALLHAIPHAAEPAVSAQCEALVEARMPPRKFEGGVKWEDVMPSCGIDAVLPA